MKASQMIQRLNLLVAEHGDLAVFTNEDSEDVGYNAEQECSTIWLSEEIDDRMIDEDNYLPERFYIKT